MRKQTKKLLSWVLTGALALGMVANINVAKVSAADDTSQEEGTLSSFTVEMGEWSDIGATGQAVTVDKSGEYTVSGESKDNYADIYKKNVYMATNLPNPTQDLGTKITLTPVSVSVNGTEHEFGTLIVNETNPLEFTVYNPYNEKLQPEQPEVVAAKKGDLVQFKFKITIAGSGGDDPDPGPVDRDNVIDQELWAKPGIHAYISWQMAGTFDYRNGYNPTKTFADKDSYQFIKDGKHPDGATDGSGVVANDVLLNKDGTYTVSVSGIDLSGSSKYNMLAISTDLDSDVYDGLAITDVTLKIDDEVVNEKPLTLTMKKDNQYYYMSLVNMYHKDADGPAPVLNEMNAAEELAKPMDSIEISFKVTGLLKPLYDLKNGNYVNPETNEKVTGTVTDEDLAASKDNTGKFTIPDDKKDDQKPGTSATPPTQPTKTPDTNAPAKPGAKLTSGKLVYKVTKAATAKKAGTLTVTALSKAGKKSGSLSIPATATIKGYKYNVTKLGNNVFKGASAKSVALGKNITAIPKGAFVNCKKLSTLTVKAKLKSVKKGAFKGCKKTIKVKGSTKKNRKANVKILKKSGYKKFK